MAPKEILHSIDSTSALFWFRRDLRLSDNAGLYHALKENESVLPIFIFDSTILDNLEDKKDSRVEFILETLETLQDQLKKTGTSLLVFHGKPLSIFKSLRPKAVYANGDYEPYAIDRDHSIAEYYATKNIPCYFYKDQVIFEKNEIIKGDQKPYTVFTPYSKKWKSTLKSFFHKSYPTEKHFSSFKKTNPISLPTLNQIGFQKTLVIPPERKIRTSIIERYDQQRDYPAIEGTTRLSVHLRFGTVSIRQLVELALKKNSVWLNELIWRDFYQMILWHFPHVKTKAFKAGYDSIEWRNNEKEFDAWCHGQTGYPIVDAGMRELNTTGYMHNRVRMVVASFLTKHLLIDWRWGETYFAKKLLDYDLASNNGGWQWASGSGCDAAPYFRVFNPYLQTKKFDPDKAYIKKWIPELETPAYPKPIVDHSFARKRALEAYRGALQTR